MGRRSRLIGGHLLRTGAVVPTLVQLVQRGTVTIAGGTSSNTGTLSVAVLVGRSVVAITGFTCTAPDTTQAERFPAIVLTNATTVTASRGGTGASDVVVSFEVTQYMPGVVKSVQPVTMAITNGNTATTPAITTVALGRAQFIYGGKTTTSATGALADTEATVDLAASSISGTRLGNADDLTIYGTVVEMN